MLDNCEQVVEAGAGLSELLAAASGLRILMTTRVALRLVLLVWRGEFEYYLSRFDRAWATFTRAREEAVALDGAPSGAGRALAGAYHYLGIIADTRGDYEEARAFFETALERARAAGDGHRESRVLNSLGVISWGEGEYAAAEATIQESLALAEEMGDQAATAHRLLKLGWVSNVQGAFERGRDFSRRSRDIFSALGDRGGLADSLYSLGVSLNGLGRHGEALALEEEALAMQREIGSRYGVAVCLVALGEIYLQSDLDDALVQAERHLREALAIDVDSVTVPSSSTWATCTPGKGGRKKPSAPFISPCVSRPCSTTIVSRAKDVWRPWRRNWAASALRRPSNEARATNWMPWPVLSLGRLLLIKNCFRNGTNREGPTGTDLRIRPPPVEKLALL